MKKSIVYVKKFSFIYENNEYTFDDVLNKHMIFKYLKIVILEEILYIKNSSIKSKINDFEKYALHKIKDIFPENNEILYDYERSYNNDSIYIYSIKGREKIEFLCKDAISLQIIPVQFIIRDFINKKFCSRKENYMAAVKLYGRYYFIECSNGVFIDNYITDNFTNMNQYLKCKKLQGKMYIDMDLCFDEYLHDRLDIIKIDIARLINEKI